MNTHVADAQASFTDKYLGVRRPPEVAQEIPRWQPTGFMPGRSGPGVDSARRHVVFVSDEFPKHDGPNMSAHELYVAEFLVHGHDVTKIGSAADALSWTAHSRFGGGPDAIIVDRLLHPVDRTAPRPPDFDDWGVSVELGQSLRAKFPTTVVYLLNPSANSSVGREQQIGLVPVGAAETPPVDLAKLVLSVGR